MGELGFPRILRSARRLPGRMAGAGWRRAWRSRPGAAPGIRSRRAPRLALLLALSFVGTAQAEVVAARIWPAPEYTRLTLETKEELKYTLFTVKDPDRLVLEIET